ncbi:MAG: hypothetical protein M1824_004019 [Vezdaea acicularis]|nr:MAG: hypothetical protein M1824_004019 [Vezdaea acicularis]
MSLPYRNVPNSSQHDRPESPAIGSSERPKAKIQEVAGCSDHRDKDSLVGSCESFNVFTGLINYPELLFEVAGHLDLEDLISLYAISRDFHNVMNTRFTAMIIYQARVQSPESSRVFSFRAYRTLCHGDPSGQQNEGKVTDVRLVPTFRWLRMVYFRDKVVQDIIRNLAAAGHMLPPRASLVLKKVWMALDIGTNAKRIGLFHNPALWSDEDLYIATMFFIKLDMRLSDPVDGCGESTFRKMMMGQRSLSILCTCLNAGGRLRQLDIL